MAVADAIVMGSAAFMGLMGLVVLLVGPRRAVSLYFGVFLLVWALDIVFVQASRVSDRPQFFLQLGSIFILLESLLVVHLAALLARPVEKGRPYSIGAAIFAALAGTWFMLRPSAFVAGGAFTIAGSTVLILPNRLAFLLAIGLLVDRLRRPAARSERIRVAFVLGALALYLGDLLGFYAAAYVLSWAAFVNFQGTAVTIAVATVTWAATAIYLGLVTLHAHRMRTGRTGLSTNAAAALLLALLVPLLLGALDAFTTAWRPDWLQVAVIYRVVLAALIAYGLLKYHLFGLDLRLKRTVSLGFPVVVAGAVELPVEYFTGALQEALPGWQQLLLTLIVFAGAGTLAAPFRNKAADLVFPYVDDTDAYQRARALQVYQAALAPTVERGATDDPFLGRLREDLNITAWEHERLVRTVQRQLSGAERTDEPQVFLGRYEAVQLLGDGVTAATWLAEDRTGDRKVIVKQLHDPALAGTELEAARMLGREARHVTPLLDAGQQDGEAVLVVEYVKSRSLRTRLEEEGALALDDALDIARQMLLGLDELHRAGIAHRNLKPANVLIMDDHALRLTDYGLAPDRKGKRGRHAVVVAAEHGSLPYASPERIRGEPEDARSDVHAAGAILYRMLTGRHYVVLDPFDEAATRAAILSAEPVEPLAGVPDHVNRVLDRSLARARNLRYPDARSMLEELDRRS